MNAFAGKVNISDSYISDISFENDDDSFFTITSSDVKMKNMTISNI